MNAKSPLTTDAERQLFKELNRAYDDYLAAAGLFVALSLGLRATACASRPDDLDVVQTKPKSTGRFFA